MATKSSGQTLVEFLIVLPVLLAAIGGTFWLLSATARRTQCAKIVFEVVHSTSHGRKLFETRGVSLRRSSDGVEGWKKCGTHVEHLFLPYLGHRSPG